MSARDKMYWSDQEKDQMVPDMIIEASETETYLFYANFGISSTEEKGWAICYVVTDADTTSRTWANSNRNFDCVANEYLGYTYGFLK